MSQGSQSRLAVRIDGVFLPDEEARALWKEFSEHMDANRGDMAGFAKKKGFVSVAPEYQKGRAVLVVKGTANADPRPLVKTTNAGPKPPRTKKA